MIECQTYCLSFGEEGVCGCVPAVRSSATRVPGLPRSRNRRRDASIRGRRCRGESGAEIIRKGGLPCWRNQA
jgi:hypothetical protein